MSDICPACGEHAEFDEETNESDCCGAKPYNPEPDDWDLER